MKTFKQMFDEEMMTSGDAGIPQDTKDMGPKKKKKKYAVLTRNYIEVNGVRKKQVK